jgi:molecular chaperone Hsp33
LALLVAQPDCDLAWLDQVSSEEVALLAADDSRPPMETRVCRFACGCTPEKIAAAIGPALAGRLDELFDGDPQIRVTCPRCGARHEIGREAFATESGGAAEPL